MATGPLKRRVVAQNLSSAMVCPGLLLLSQVYGRTAYVDLALLLALLGPVGTLVLARLLAGELAVGAVPGFVGLVGHTVDEAGTWGVFSSVEWTATGVLLDLLSTAPAVGLAALAVTRPQLLGAPEWALPLRRLQSGHVGDYGAWLLVGTALLGAPVLPGVLG
ncbi:MrpF/PhaF family protein [Streptomyces triticisoli]|uniref:MrpF/PhaF family protein n=1 Tax=Streptomyces triticisoli TaxID=2182797 RepID=UPI003F699705